MMKLMAKISFGKLIVSIILPLVAGFLGSLATAPKILSWYVGVNKPFFNPPNWVFGPVWTILFILMGIALYLFWVGKGKNKREGFKWFGLQLALNIGWSLIFFGLEMPGLALVEILILWWAIKKTIACFAVSNKTASRLLYPYLGWVSFATILNAAVWFLNR